MKIGLLNSPEIGAFPTVTYTRAGGHIPFLTEQNESGSTVFPWKTHHATYVEMHCRFPKEIYLASLVIAFEENLPETLEIFDENGACVGSSKACKAQTEITVGATGRCFTLRLLPTFTDIAVSALSFYGADIAEIQLYPTPKSTSRKEGFIDRLQLTATTHDADADCLFAANFWAERIQKRWGATSVKGSGLRLKKDDTLPCDGYTLTIDEAGATLCAANRLGLLYGLERLLELEQDGKLPCCTVSDAPYKEMRGVHLYLPDRQNIPFFKSLVKNILIPYHYNQIFLEFAGGMRFDRHPEISEGWLRGNALAKAGKIPPFPHGSVANGELLEKDEVRELCDFVHDLGFELIPEVQSLGHVQYITYAHPDVAEIDPEADKTATDERTADVPPSLFYKHSYCPQNKKSYEIIHDLIDEIVEVARPKRYVHMGHDEVYQLGLCPKCREIAPDLLYEADVMDLYRYLAKKGLGMMLWADMVQPVSKYRCFPCLERLPKDIVWLDFIWYFHLDKDIEENLLANGNKVMIGNLYSSHFPRYEKRMAQDGMLGGEVSFWTKTEEECVAREGKFYDLLYTAEMLWSACYQAQLRPYYADIIAKRLPRLRAAIRGTQLYRAKEALALPVTHQKQIGTDALPLASGYTAAVNGTAAALRFLHTTLYREKRIAWSPLVEIGHYTVEYEDGSTARIPVTYDGNVRCHQFRYGEPLKEKYYRHEGYVCTWMADPVVCCRTDNGTPVTLYALEWENPFPQKKILRIHCAESEESAAGLLLCAISVLTSEEK